MSDVTDLNLLGKPIEQNLAEARDTRRELGEVRRLTLLLVEQLRRTETRLDARMAALRDDIELLLKAEIMGNRAHIETTLEQKIEALAERVSTLES